MASSSSTKVTLKLLIDTKNEKVLFAETSKAVADFLFSMLSLPIGTIVKLIGKDCMVRSLGNLYHSAENLNEDYVKSGQTNDVVLNQKLGLISGLLPTASVSAFLLLNELEDEDMEGDKDYSEDEEEEDEMSDEDYEEEEDEMSYEDYEEEEEEEESEDDEENPVGINSIEKGFVEDITTIFMVTDDLVIQPMPTLSIMQFINKFNITDIGTLQEKVVELGSDEAIKLLKASLQSKMVLTSVFIKNEY